MPPDTTKWDIESLKKTALAFPDAVAACPERISAIITKYTALRSLHEQNQRGFPLSYENAGFHAHDLLDSYSDYKVILSSLRTMITNVHRNGSKLVEQNKRPELAELADKIEKAFDARKSAMATKQQIISTSTLGNFSLASAGASGNVDSIIVEDLLPFNPLIPYKASIVGLEEAMHDARYEMTKMAKEVSISFFNFSMPVEL